MEKFFVTQNGTKLWKNSDGQVHRAEDEGPAVEYVDGHKFWYQYGKCHRLNGPAEESASGLKYWFYKGKYIDCKSQQEFERFIKLLSFL